MGKEGQFMNSHHRSSLLVKIFVVLVHLTNTGKHRYCYFSVAVLDADVHVSEILFGLLQLLNIQS
jgi:hypothetical protein